MKKKPSRKSLTWKTPPSVINDRARKTMAKLARKRELAGKGK